jgi:hypothetical protein
MPWEGEAGIGLLLHAASRLGWERREYCGADGHLGRRHGAVAKQEEEGGSKGRVDSWKRSSAGKSRESTTTLTGSDQIVDISDREHQVLAYHHPAHI